MKFKNLLELLLQGASTGMTSSAYWVKLEDQEKVKAAGNPMDRSSRQLPGSDKGRRGGSGTSWMWKKPFQGRSSSGGPLVKENKAASCIPHAGRLHRPSDGSSSSSSSSARQQQRQQPAAASAPAPEKFISATDSKSSLSVDEKRSEKSSKKQYFGFHHKAARRNSRSSSASAGREQQKQASTSAPGPERIPSFEGRRSDGMPIIKESKKASCIPHIGPFHVSRSASSSASSSSAAAGKQQRPDLQNAAAAPTPDGQKFHEHDAGCGHRPLNMVVRVGRYGRVKERPHRHARGRNWQAGHRAYSSLERLVADEERGHAQQPVRAYRRKKYVKTRPHRHARGRNWNAGHRAYSSLERLVEDEERDKRRRGYFYVVNDDGDLLCGLDCTNKSLSLGPSRMNTSSPLKKTKSPSQISSPSSSSKSKSSDLASETLVLDKSGRCTTLSVHPISRRKK